MKINSLSQRFLLYVLPVIFVVSVLFLNGMALFERNKLKDINIILAEERVNNLAKLLADPLWQLMTNSINGLIEASLQENNVICIELAQTFVGTEKEQSTFYGECDEKVSGSEVITSPIYYSGRFEDSYLGQLKMTFQIQPSFKEIYTRLNSQIALALVMIIAISISAFYAFKWTVVQPLLRVSDSLKLYQITGKRQAVDWESTDELGLLIADYNSNLQLQSETEKKLLASKSEVEAALQNLQNAQDLLVQSEKLASLGRMVAGIAHELNTPIGNCRTVVSSLHEKTIDFKDELESGQLKRSSLTCFMDAQVEALRILETSLVMAITQVANFKQVAVDQTSEQQRLFNLKAVLDEVIYTMRPKLKHTKIKLELDVPDSIELDSFPGPLGQIVSNCINNSLLHGFEENQEGEICITASLQGEEHVDIVFADNGAGMNEEQKKHAFDPFFTTKIGRGGTGLGLNIVYNIINNVLKGSVSLMSNPGKGVILKMCIPLKVIKS